MNSTRTLPTKNNLLEFIKERWRNKKDTSLEDITKNFNIDKASRLRYDTNDKIPKDWKEIIEYQFLASKIYEGTYFPTKLFRAIKTLIILSDKKEIYISENRKSIVPTGE